MREIRIQLESGDARFRLLVREKLVSLGIPEEELVETSSPGGTHVSLFVRSRLESRCVVSRVRDMRLEGMRVSDRALKDSDWKTRWKRYFKPFDITPEVRVMPAARLRKTRQSRTGEIIIDTSVAFGTGLHATTRMMCGYIRRARGEFRSFLDIGTGSGILALVAAAYGAERIVAVDCDPQAVATACRNFARNGCTAQAMTADFGSWNAGQRFDFVAANLLTQDLIRLRSRLCRAVSIGGYLAVSGVFAENTGEFRRNFLGRPFRLLKEHRRQKWYSALFAYVGRA